MKNRLVKSIFVIMGVIMCGLLAGCSNNSNNTSVSDDENINNNSAAIGELEVHYLDVGKGDCILIKQGDYSMLIDAGYKKNGEDIYKYLSDNGVNKLDVVIATHPDKDHIGGMSYIVNNVQIDKFYMPNVVKDSNQYEDLMTSINNKNITITNPLDEQQRTFNFGEAKCTILAPNSDSYEDINDYSIVLKVEFGETSFLFCGDALNTSENEMLANNEDVSADVIKIGHHGNDDATSNTFLSAVNPKYAVICVSNDEKDELPELDVMNLLKAHDIEVYRTDENGNIIAKSNGKNIEFNVEPGSYNGY